jgi:hypothetical protein
VINYFQNFRNAWKTPRLRSALVIAVVSDILGFAVVLLPPVQWALDAVTAVLLLVVLGFRWQLLAALTIEVIPFLELFPAWTLVVMALAATTDQESIGK